MVDKGVGEETGTGGGEVVEGGGEVEAGRGADEDDGVTAAVVDNADEAAIVGRAEEDDSLSKVALKMSETLKLPAMPEPVNSMKSH